MTRLLLLAVPALLLVAACQHRQQGPVETVETKGPAPDPTWNVVQMEMQLLTTVLENAMRAVGDGDVSHVAKELHQLHQAKEATEAAVKDGSYTLPKGSDQVPTFLAMDDAFHKQLEAMVRASRANDVPAMAQAIGNTLNACHGCHALFRDP